MKKYCLVAFLLICLSFTGCSGSNEDIIDVLETCKVIDSTIKETSISADGKYFTITFDNGLVYCEDHTSSSGYIIYTIKVPVTSEIDILPILQSINSSFTQEDYDVLGRTNSVTWGYRDSYCTKKIIEGDTVKYTVK